MNHAEHVRRLPRATAQVRLCGPDRGGVHYKPREAPPASVDARAVLSRRESPSRGRPEKTVRVEPRPPPCTGLEPRTSSPPRKGGAVSGRRSLSSVRGRLPPRVCGRVNGRELRVACADAPDSEASTGSEEMRIGASGSRGARPLPGARPRGLNCASHSALPSCRGPGGGFHATHHVGRSRAARSLKPTAPGRADAPAPGGLVMHGVRGCL